MADAPVSFEASLEGNKKIAARTWGLRSVCIAADKHAKQSARLKHLLQCKNGVVCRRQASA